MLEVEEETERYIEMTGLATATKVSHLSTPRHRIRQAAVDRWLSSTVPMLELWRDKLNEEGCSHVYHESDATKILYLFAMLMSTKCMKPDPTGEKDWIVSVDDMTHHEVEKMNRIGDLLKKWAKGQT